MGGLVWDWPVALYLWLASLGAGIYLVAFLADQFSADGEERLLGLGVELSVPCFLMALAALLLQSRNLQAIWLVPEALMPESAVSLAAWSLAATVAVGLPLLLLRLAVARDWPVIPGEALLRRMSTWLYAGGCCAVALVTGWFLMDTSNTLWAASYLLAELLVASAALCGVASILVLSRSREVDASSSTLGALRDLQPLMLVVQLLLLGALLANLALQPTTFDAALPLLSVTIAGILLWGGAVFGGLLLPLVIELWLGPAREWDLYPSRLLMASPLLVIAGAFALRLAFVAAGQA